jgi:BlaI family penicillinase repressor
VGAAPAPGRRAILDIAPLELECLRALWPLGQATVREVRRAMAPRLPRAYTTVMTILDRLAQKGVVAREKKGRAWLYRPLLTEEEARAGAVGQVVEHFFDGSARALAAHLAREPMKSASRFADARAASPASRAVPAEFPAAAPQPAEPDEAPNRAAASREDDTRRAARPRREADDAGSAAREPAASSDSPAGESSAGSPALDPTLL